MVYVCPADETRWPAFLSWPERALQVLRSCALYLQLVCKVDNYHVVASYRHIFETLIQARKRWPERWFEGGGGSKRFLSPYPWRLEHFSRHFRKIWWERQYLFVKRVIFSSYDLLSIWWHILVGRRIITITDMYGHCVIAQCTRFCSVGTFIFLPPVA